MRNFYAELKRATGRPWILSVLIIEFMLVIENAAAIPHAFSERVNSIDLMINGFYKSALPTACLLCVCLPYAASYLQDRESGAIMYQISRCGRTRWIISRFVANALAGASAVIFAELLFFAMASIAYPYPDIGYRFATNPGVLDEWLYARPASYFFSIMGLQTISLMGWASLALGLSGIVKNKYIAMFIPFLAVTLASYAGDSALGDSVYGALLFIVDFSLYEETWFPKMTMYLALFATMLALSFALFYSEVTRYDASSR